MEVKLIGTGGIFSPSNSACTLINKHILIDIPNGSLKAMRKNGITVTNIDTIFITHLHGDHYFDIPFLLLEKYKDDKSILKIIGPAEAEEKIKALTELAFPDAFRKIFRSLKIEYVEVPKDVQADGMIFTALSMKHGNTDAYGYILKNKDKKIGFTGDTALCESVEKMASSCGTVVIDTTFEVGTKTHLGVNDILMLLKKYPNTTLIPTHMGKKERKILSFQSFDNLLLLSDMDNIE